MIYKYVIIKVHFRFVFLPPRVVPYLSFTYMHAYINFFFEQVKSRTAVDNMDLRFDYLKVHLKLSMLKFIEIELKRLN